MRVRVRVRVLVLQYSVSFHCVLRHLHYLLTTLIPKQTTVPILALFGGKPGRDKERTLVNPDAVALWRQVNVHVKEVKGYRYR